MDILTFLAGGALSLLTLFVTKWFDLQTIKKNHKQALIKEFFIKKLTAFEKGTSYYTIAHHSITTMAMIFKTTQNEDVSYPDEVVQKMFDEIEKSVKEVAHLTQDLAMALPLYTDVQLTEADDQTIEKYFELLGEISQNGILINSMYDEARGINSAIEKENLYTKIDVKTKVMEERILSLVSQSRIIKLKYKGITSKLRNELKKYDV